MMTSNLKVNVSTPVNVASTSKKVPTVHDLITSNEQKIQNLNGGDEDSRNEDTILEQQVKQQIRIMTGEGESEKIVGHDTIIHAIEDSFIAINSISPDAKVQPKISKSFLLVGLPGTGKTSIMTASVNSAARLTKASISLFVVKPSTLMSKYTGTSEKIVKALYRVANSSGLSVLFYDEVDGIMKSRSDEENDFVRRFKTNLLAEMEGVNSYPRVVTIAATNRPWDLDIGFYRRFDFKFLVKLPSPYERFEIFKEYIGNVPNEVDFATDEYYDMIVEKTEGFTGADICRTMKNVIQKTFRRVYEGKLVSPDQYRNVTDQKGVQVKATWIPLKTREVEVAFDKAVSSVKPDELRKIEKWAIENCDNVGEEDDVAEKESFMCLGPSFYLSCFCIPCINRC